MKRFLGLACLLVCAISLGWAELIPLTLLHTNDFHAQLLPDEAGKGGAAILAGYYQQVRRLQKNLLILDAGDQISGTPVSSLFKGEPIYPVLNHWGLDAAALGNHEFDYGREKIARYRELAKFPLICANSFARSADGKNSLLADEEYHIFQRGNLRVGVIGVVSEHTPLMTVQDAVRDVTFAAVVPTLQRLVPIVSTQSDLVIVLSHIGYENDEKLAESVSNIHLIIGGHSHTALQEYKSIRGIYIVQAGKNGQYVGRIDLVFDTETKRIQSFTYRLLPVNAELAAPDPETEKEVKNWESKVSELVDRPLGTAVEDLTPRLMNGIVEAAMLEATNADYAFQNDGGTRAAIPKGSFTYRTVWNILPFENTLVAAQIPGKEIPQRFHGPGPIDPNREYKIVTNSFVRDQWKNYEPNLSHLRWVDTGFFLRDSVFKYIERKKTISPIHWEEFVKEKSKNPYDALEAHHSKTE